MKSYFEHLSNKKHFFKNHYWENPQNPFKNLQNKKKEKEIFPLSFYYNAKRTHWNQWLSAPFGEKISFSCCSRFLLSVLWKSVWLSAHPLFRGSSRYFQSIGKAWIVREVTQVWNTAQFAQNHAVFCDLWLCEGFIVSEVFWGAWIVSMAISACLGFFCLNLNENPVIVRPFFVLFVARCNIRYAH